jgi:hypothetical protein
MPDQARAAADLSVDRDDLERAQVDLHDTLEQMIDALDAGNAIKPKLFGFSVAAGQFPTLKLYVGF